MIFPLFCSILITYGAAAFLVTTFSLTGGAIGLPVAWMIIAVSTAAGLAYFRVLSGPAAGRSRIALTASEKRLLAAGVVFYLLLWAVAYVLPDSKNDGLWYHNPTLHFWAREGRIHWIAAEPEPFWNDLIDYSWNGYVKGVEGLGFLFLRAVPVSRLLNGLNLLFIPLGCLGIVTLARFLGAGRFPSLLAGVLFLFVPNVICHAFDLYIDAAVASFYISLFAVSVWVLRCLETGNNPGKYLPALGCAFGLSLSSKGPAVVLLGLVPLLLAVYWVRAVRRSRSTRGKGVVFIALALAIAVLSGGFWHLRNYLRTGTPLYPIGMTLAGREIFPGVEVPHQFPPPNIPLDQEWPQLFRVLYSWLDNPGELHLALTEVSHNSGGLGLIWLLGGLPALIWILARILRRRTGWLPPGNGAAWLGIVALGAVLFFAMPPRHNHKVRYVIWLHGLGLPAFALAAERSWRSLSPRRRRRGRTWVAAVVAVFLAQGLYSFGHHVRRISLTRQGVRQGSFRASHLLRAAVEPYPPAYYLPELLGSLYREISRDVHPVALAELDSFDEQKNIIGHLTQGEAFGVRSIHFLNLETASDPAALSRFLRERGIRYVVWDPAVPVPSALGRRALVWDRVLYWYYFLLVDPEGWEGTGMGWRVNL